MMLTLYFDRNVGKQFPFAVSRLKPPFEVRWHQGERFRQDMPDDEWLAEVSNRGWVVVSQDRKFHILPNELEAIRSNNGRCFYFPCASEVRWITMRNLIRVEKKLRYICNSVTGPFIYDLRSTGQLSRVH